MVKYKVDSFQDEDGVAQWCYVGETVFDDYLVGLDYDLCEEVNLGNKLVKQYHLI